MLRAFSMTAWLAASLEQEAGQSSQIGPLGPPGVPANLFPLPHRPVAGIVSEEWSTEEARDRDGEAEQIMNFLGVGPGMRVAGLGAGAGYYTIRLARRVQAAWRNGRNAHSAVCIGPHAHATTKKIGA